VDLPNLFEEAIQESEVKKQDIKKADAELHKVMVEVDTKIKSAKFQKTVAINIAEGDASAMIQQNQANVDSLIKVQNSQSRAYRNLKQSLGMENSDLLDFIKTKVVKGYEGKNLALNINSPEPIKKLTK
jgi:CRISPR/Cas system-associated endonuclease Cas3-HD